MHAVAMKPRYLSPETVPADALEGKSGSICAADVAAMSHDASVQTLRCYVVKQRN